MTTTILQTTFKRTMTKYNSNTDKRMHFILIEFTLLNIKTYIKYCLCSTKYILSIIST